MKATNIFSSTILSSVDKIKALQEAELNKVPENFVGLKIYMNNQEEAKALYDSLEQGFKASNPEERYSFLYENLKRGNPFKGIRHIQLSGKDIFVVTETSPESIQAFTYSLSKEGRYTAFSDQFFHYLQGQCEESYMNILEAFSKEESLDAVMESVNFQTHKLGEQQKRYGLPSKLGLLCLQGQESASEFIAGTHPDIAKLDALPIGYQPGAPKSYIYHDGKTFQRNSWGNHCFLSHDLDLHFEEIAKAYNEGYIHQQLRNGLIAFLENEWELNDTPAEYFADSLLSLAINNGNRGFPGEILPLLNVESGALFGAVVDRYNLDPNDNGWEDFLDYEEYKLYRGFAHREANDNYAIIHDFLGSVCDVKLKRTYDESSDPSVYFEGILTDAAGDKVFPKYTHYTGELGFAESLSFLDTLSYQSFNNLDRDVPQLKHLLNSTMYLIKAMKVCAYNLAFQETMKQALPEFEGKPIKEVRQQVRSITDELFGEVDGILGDCSMPDLTSTATFTP